MEGQLPDPRQNVDLERVLEFRIAQRTSGCIRQLRVEVTSNCVTVRGYTQQYYYKQLALQVVVEALCPKDSRLVEIDIVVAPAEHGAARP
jgi:hypothetical protein